MILITRKAQLITVKSIKPIPYAYAHKYVCVYVCTCLTLYIDAYNQI